MGINWGTKCSESETFGGWNKQSGWNKQLGWKIEDMDIARNNFGRLTTYEVSIKSMVNTSISIVKAIIKQLSGWPLSK